MGSIGSWSSWYNFVIWFMIWHDSASTRSEESLRFPKWRKKRRRCYCCATVALLSQNQKIPQIVISERFQAEKAKKTIKSEQTKQAKKETEEPDTLKVVQTYGADSFAFGYFWTDPLLHRFTELLSDCPLQNFQNTQGTAGSTQPETLQKGWAPVNPCELQQPQSMKMHEMKPHCGVFGVSGRLGSERQWSNLLSYWAAYHENNESTKKQKKIKHDSNW